MGRQVSDFFPRLRGFVWPLALLFLLGTVTPLMGQTRTERKKGIYGTIVDSDGNPVPKMRVTLTENREGAKPLVVKTNKKGQFVYPRVEFINEYYKLGIDAEEYYIKKFHFKVRRLNFEIWQDDSAALSPQQQGKIPDLRYRGGNAMVEFVVEKIADYVPEVAAAEQAKANAEIAAKKAGGRELTPREEAEGAVLTGDYATAVAKFSEALSETPDDVELLLDYADALAKKGDFGAALRESAKVLRLEPDRTGVRVKMARWYDEEGRLANAVPLLEKEHELLPTDAQVNKFLVAAYTAADRKDDARKAAEDWVAASPDDPEALLALADMKARSGDLAGAEELYTAVAEKSPDAADRVFFNIGASIMNKKSPSAEDRKRAVAAFERCLAVNPKYAKAHIEMAYALVGLGDMEAAKKHFRSFIEIAPHDRRAAEAKGMLEVLP